METPDSEDHQLEEAIEFLVARGLTYQQAEDTALAIFAIGMDSGISVGFLRGFLVGLACVLLTGAVGIAALSTLFR